MAKTSKLDPKRAKHFNETIINDYFDLREELDRQYDGIPPEHIWNMDEKGVQMGGGQKKCSKKFYYLRSQKHRYRIQSDNLELVMIVECILGVGDVVPPSFCLQNGTAPDLRTLEDHEWGRFVFSLYQLDNSNVLIYILASIFPSLAGQTHTIVKIGLMKSSFLMQRNTVSIPQSQSCCLWMVMTHMKPQLSSVPSISALMTKIWKLSFFAFP